MFSFEWICDKCKNELEIRIYTPSSSVECKINDKCSLGTGKSWLCSNCCKFIGNCYGIKAKDTEDV